MVPAGTLPREGDLWGTWPLYRAPETVLDVHRAYVAAGCDVISTDTWSVLTDTDGSGEAKSGLLHWMDIARTGIRLARTAAAEDTDRPRAVAFSVSDEAESLGRAGTARLLARIFEDEPPDLILLETLSLIREPDTFDLVSSLVELGLAALALLSALPARRLRRLRPALGASRGRSLRPRGDAVRGDGRGGAPDQLPPRRPRPRDDELAARLHRHAARRLPEPRPPRRAGCGASTTASIRRRTRGSRSSGARRARRSSAAAAA